jgi:hypothetical protein
LASTSGHHGPAAGDGGVEADTEGDAPVLGPEPCGAVRDLFAARGPSDGLRRVGSSNRVPEVDMTEVGCGLACLL